jgi:hypothetical protein
MAIKKRRRPKTNRDYFTKETEDAIILYNKLEDPILRSRLYQKGIHYAFFKLTQNIIHTFKFYNTEVNNLEDLQHEITVFLLSKIHLYNQPKNLEDRFKKIITREFKYYSYKNYLKKPILYYHEGSEDGIILDEKAFHENIMISSQFPLYKEGSFLSYVGDVDKVTQQQINDFIETLNVDGECLAKLQKFTPPKAFSYFGTITKRWLIVYNDKNYNTKVSSVSTDELFKENSKHTYLLDDPKDHNDRLSDFIDNYIEHITNNIYTLFPKKQDAKVADAILELFRSRENIDIFNKKALYFEVREKGDFKTPKITKISEMLYKMFKDHYQFYLENDYMNFRDLQV